MLVAILALGFFLGMRHATDADHVVAVSTIVGRERRIGSAAVIGALWGIGHTLTIFAVGIGIIAFTLIIPPRVGLSLEFSVGLMLLLLGGWNLRSFSKTCRALPGERTGADSQLEAGTDGDDHHHGWMGDRLGLLDRKLGGWSVFQWIRPLVVGLLHGLAGSAAVALLVLTTVHDSRWAAAYLLVFGLGTVAGMMIITVAMASALRLVGSRSAWINQRLSIATGFVSVVFGLFIIYQMGFVHGLFTAHPDWVPK